jgi:hypothetical protein
VERFVAEMPVALTRRQALAVELRRVLERETAAGGAKVDGPANGEEVLHGARPERAIASEPTLPDQSVKPRR